MSGSPALVIFAFHHTQGSYYLDAGTGSIIIQALIGGFVGVLFALKIFWSKVKAFLKALFKRGKTDEVVGH